jgi:MFS family permease
MATTLQSAPDPRRWWALALLCGAFFMVILDAAIVTVALPSIEKELDFSAQGLQWVVSAYALTFAGLLLLGGRAADLLGRRRVFMVGVVVFTLASLLCGLAWSDSALIGARALQGIGAAVMTPSALSIVTTTFEEGAERNKALGIWGALGGVGATTAWLIGGPIVDGLGWEWIFFINKPKASSRPSQPSPSSPGSASQSPLRSSGGRAARRERSSGRQLPRRATERRRCELPALGEVTAPAAVLIRRFEPVRGLCRRPARRDFPGSRWQRIWPVSRLSAPGHCHPTALWFLGFE